MRKRCAKTGGPVTEAACDGHGRATVKGDRAMWRTGGRHERPFDFERMGVFYHAVDDSVCYYLAQVKDKTANEHVHGGRHISRSW